MGYRSNCGLLPPGSPSRRDARHDGNNPEDRFTTSYNRSFLGHLPIGRFRRTLQPRDGPEASLSPSSGGFASNAFDSGCTKAKPPGPAAPHKLSGPSASRPPMGSAALGHSQSDTTLRPNIFRRAQGGLGASLMPAAPAQGHKKRPGSASRSDALLPALGRFEGSAPHCDDLRAQQPSEGNPTLTLASETPKGRRKSKPELQRTISGLANPDLKNIAHAKFNRQNTPQKGHLDFNAMVSVLHELYADLGLQDPDYDRAQRLFKKFDVNNSETLDFSEFFDLLLSLLRHDAFDRSALLGRDFFVTKHKGSVWVIYERISELGSGVFGTALLVRQRLTGEQQVVKAVRKGRVQIPIEDVEREILMLRQLDHPHVVRLRRWYEDKHSIYLVMDYLRGGSLKQKLAGHREKKHAIEERWIRTLIQQVLQAMSYCHGLRLIHKDLKDENIMLLKSKSNDPDREPFAVIIDLGMAEMFTPEDFQCRQIGGTPVTMAPQVWHGTFGPKCDVWSAGCVLYQLLAGKVPFSCNSLKAEHWTLLHRQGADWSLVKASHAGRELCKAMLTYSEENRPTMATCLEHQWFDLERKELHVIQPAQFAHVQEQYSHGCALKRALLLELASQLPMDDADRIVEIFKDFDTNHDGQVSESELRSAFLRMGLDEQLAQRTFQTLDLDGDGQLSFTDFSSWVLLAFEDLLEDRLYKKLSEYSDDPDSNSLGREGVQRFAESMEHMLKKGSAERSSLLLKELRSRNQGPMSYKELKERLLGPG